MVFQDINRFFPSLEEADGAFTLFDRDGNGDVSLEEVEQACAFVMLLLPCSFISYRTSQRDPPGTAVNRAFYERPR
jgi:Ca2+-binding EF-hand superfamily protein